ncbi:MAG: hypothetical protein N2606_02270 [Candidatus Omnitrophica bacterium]|nr:hypothetical protein [Candidatus Omnitrophota bacterium]
MLEVINEIEREQLRQVEDFLAFIGIYDDYRRTKALKRLLISQKKAISGRVGVEAGAGLGEFTEFLLHLGAQKVYAVEENALCCRLLREKFKHNRRVEVVEEHIEHFHPKEKIDFLFQELYGALLLDENLLSLERIKFKPTLVIPNAGSLLFEEMGFKQLKDPTLTEERIKLLEGVLVSDLFPYFEFRHPKILAQWIFKRGKRDYTFYGKVKLKKGILALGMEIFHNNKVVVGTVGCYNWPYIFTPIVSDKFEISFKYTTQLTQVFWKWL